MVGRKELQMLKHVRDGWKVTNANSESLCEENSLSQNGLRPVFSFWKNWREANVIVYEELMDMVAREVKARTLGRGAEFIDGNGQRCEISQLLNAKEADT